jgi:hypothetical protein
MRDPVLYESRWGRHATGAMHALHRWLVDNGALE